MLKSLLIANRGEIARRIIKTCKRLGVRTIAVYSDADAGALHVREADEAVHIGPSPARESYLRGEAIIAAARKAGAEAIHPGYGFLSENAEFAEAVIEAGLIWIGPSPASIRAMGLKDAAKKLMSEAGVAVTPGYQGEAQSAKALAKAAAEIGYPILIKAVAGGGGRGMRTAMSAAEFSASLEAAKREAQAAFGDDRVLLEMLVAKPRHIEVQVFGDQHGRIVHLFERDCSLQRRHQKVIEEAPAPGMDQTTRASVCEAALRAARAVNYVGAGTVEFIADASEGLRADRIWFMEMNTRLQVEHPVTEAVTGLDLVEWQLRVASGEPLPLAQEEITLRGHAIEARLCAEAPARGFLPSIGVLRHFEISGEGRVDHGFEAGDRISAHYDSLLAKLIAHAPTRDEAIAKLAALCSGVEIAPISSNAGFLVRCLNHPRFKAGEIDTGFVAEGGDALIATPPLDARISNAAVRAFAAVHQGDGPWSALAGFRLNTAPDLRMALLYEGAPLEGMLVPSDKPRSIATGDVAYVFADGEAYPFQRPGAAEDKHHLSASDGAVRAPMPGRIVRVFVSAGDEIADGAPILALEAMKMEHVLRAPFAGCVAEIAVQEGAQVSEGQSLATLEPTP